MVLTFTCVWLQTTPDLFGGELPREVLVWFTAIGAFGQALGAIVYPELAAKYRSRPRQLIVHQQPGNDLIPPREHFVGYEEERSRISRLFDRFPPPGWRRLLHPASWRDEDNTQPALVVVITGAPGTGKSQLANQLAREFRKRFPDGVRRIDLQGDRTDFDETHLDLGERESEEPQRAEEVEQGGRRPWGPLRWWGRKHPEPETDTGTGLADDSGTPVGPWAPRNEYSLLEEALDSIGDSPRGPRRNLEQTWRRLTDGRRLLLVLENAASPEQIRPLIPNSPLSAVLVTSRRSFARPGAFADTDFDWETVELSGFADDEVGLELLERLAPVSDSASDPEEERQLRRQIVAHCQKLPIALGMCGMRLAAPAGNDARDLLTALGHVDQTPLVHAPYGFRASFTAAFQQCDRDGRLLLRRMAVTGVYQIADYSAAALLDKPRHKAAEALDELHARFLIDPLGEAEDGHARYQLHQLAADTLRARTAHDFGLGQDEKPAWSEESDRLARERLLYVYTWLAEQAAETLSHTGDGFGQGAVVPPDLIDRLGIRAPTHPQAWLERDREFLLGCAWVAGADGQPEVGRRLVRAFAAMCQTVRTHWDEWGEAVRAQRQLADAEGDPHAVAMAMLDESEYAGSRGDYDRGVTLAEAARDAFVAQGAHPRWRARSLRALGGNLQRRGDLDDARRELEHAESIFARYEETWWQARTRCNLAEVDTHVGTYAEAQRLLEQARDAFDAAGDPDHGQHTRILLAEVLNRRGHDLEAWSLLQHVRTRALEESKEGYVARCLRAMGALDSDTLERQYLLLAQKEEGSTDVGSRLPGSTAWRKARARRRSWSHRSRVAMLHEAIELLDRMGDVWGVHWTRLTLGLTLIRDGYFTKGARELDRATEGFAELADRLWRARSHRIIAERLLAAAVEHVTGSSEPVPAGIGVSTPSFKYRIDTAYAHARSAVDAYAEIGDRSGQIRAQLLLARILRAAHRPHDVDAPLRAAERLAQEHGMPHFAEEAKRLRRVLGEGGTRDHATVAEYWPIS
ncbi:hypothetical protein EFW17_08715 [Halostreptopolyspora alba]|uniref:AAA+ ATPase domain-containing protein n=2 Tax=Halostreptopolyspora alba TaxID=2487137 RepID=A0A3N0ECI4_9ACTN|nr:hypothetical protein EFW17_08715 [Nocardiopsaceae bacterium YIM 96095]